MLEVLQNKIDDALHTQIKNSIYAGHLDSIEKLVKEIKEDYPDFNADELVIKLSDRAERIACQQADMMIAYKKDMGSIIEQEVNAHKQVKVAA
jgi:hypothetical protein